MATRGQTHNKRARETALREKRERKQLKKDQRAAGHASSAGGFRDSGLESDGEKPAHEDQTVAETIQ
jgi:hypothetical protein